MCFAYIQTKCLRVSEVPRTLFFDDNVYQTMIYEFRDQTPRVAALCAAWRCSDRVAQRRRSVARDKFRRRIALRRVASCRATQTRHEATCARRGGAARRDATRRGATRCCAALRNAARRRSSRVARRLCHHLYHRRRRRRH